ncbi:MAG: hypothetical protein IKE14_05915 [Loktanella sp.]|nr:hypothetical protein [Loktanella sp.]
MTPDFALSLSHAGIDLLQRTDTGWRRVGTASLLSRDIAADLADLRAKGQALAPDGFCTKLVIPMEQVKYLALDTAQTTLADITRALDGTTPYALDALAIDFERSNGRTHIAAVAQETLREAEDFAAAHGFNPVAFVAVPDPDTFAQEIFFGPTTMAARSLGPGVSVTRDSMPVTLIGTRIKAHLLDAQTPVIATAVAAPQALLPDPIIAEYHPQASPAPLRIVLSDMAPTAPRHLDRIIGDYRAITIQTEVPLIAVPAPGSTRPVVLGGVMATVSKAALRRPAYALPGAVAASLAALGMIWWLQSGPAPVDAPATVVAQSEPAPALLDIAIAPPDQQGLAQTLPEADTAIAASLPPLPLTPDAADSSSLMQAPADGQATPPGQVLSADAAQAIYAATGVWQRPPRFVDLPAVAVLDSLTLPANSVAFAPVTAPRLPAIQTLTSDLSFVPLATPPAADRVFDLDEDGFVRATAEGALTPDGAIVYAGLPDLPFRARPAPPTDAAAPDTSVADSLADIVVIPGPPPVVPPLRPATVAAATPGGVSLAGLQPGASGPDASDDLAPPAGAIRPRARPALPEAANTANEIDAVLGGIALATPDPRATGSGFAVATSLRPTSRPTNFDRVVAAARSRQQPAAAAQPTPGAIAAAPAPAEQPQVQAAAPVAPQNYEPVPGGVARAATQDSAIRLRDINLIGVYGQPSARRALVRLGNGQFVRVQVGSELDGGQVTAIGENALNYVKRGTTHALQIPQG